MVRIDDGRIVFSKLGEASSNQAFSGFELSKIISEKIARDIRKCPEFVVERKTEEPKLVKVQFITSPRGATVEIDGVLRGNTEVFYQASEGIHAVRLTMPGYQDWVSKKVLFKDEQTFKITLLPER